MLRMGLERRFECCPVVCTGRGVKARSRAIPKLKTGNFRKPYLPHGRKNIRFLAGVTDVTDA